MATASAVSTSPEAVHAATQALAPEALSSAPTAIDGVIAGVMAVAAKTPGALLGAGVLLLGGRGEGLRVFDGRARQPGRGAARPRGYTAADSVPDIARVAAPVFPSALVLAHAGRGTRTLTALARIGLASAGERGTVDASRIDSIRTFGREGASFLRTGKTREALLASAPRSQGGQLTGEDLDAMQPSIEEARVIKTGNRAWAVAPFASIVASTVEGGAADGGRAEEAELTRGDSVVVVAASDTHGAVAIACFVAPAHGIALEGTGLVAPLLARPVMRGVTRESPGNALALPCPIALSSSSSRGAFGRVDLVLGMGGSPPLEAMFGRLVAEASATPVEQAILKPRARMTEAGEVREESPTRGFGVACGLLIDAGDNARAVSDPRR